MTAPMKVFALRRSNLSLTSTAYSDPPAYEPTTPSSAVPRQPSRVGLGPR